MSKKEKIIVVVGPTASGKTSLAIKLAKKYNGEVISADSRQVYRGLDIGTGKVTKREMEGVPHHMLDVVSPKKTYTAADFARDARECVRYIVQKGKVPIVAGGTGFYIDTLLGTAALPEVPPNPALRANLEKQKVETLFRKLKKQDPRRAKAIDPQNKRRIIRALEIVDALGKVPKKLSIDISKDRVLKMGIQISDEKLKKNIAKRLKERLKQGMVAEAKKLYAKGLSWKRMNELGLEYRYVPKYVRGQMSKKEMTEKLEIEIRKYAKRQKTWFKRDKNIVWVAPKKEQKKIDNLVKTFLTQ